MSWIGISDLRVPAFDPRGVGAAPVSAAPEPDDGILPVGSLVIEVTYVAQSRIPQRILRYEKTRGWLRRFSVILSADGVLAVDARQGDTLSHAQVTIAVPPRETRLRITYSWNAPQRTGILTAENLDQEVLHQAEFDAPVPLPLEDGRDIITNGDATRIGRDTRYLALSDQVEPVGLASGIARGTPVETPTGPRLVERLRLGDLVMTAGSGPQPVRWIVRREVPALGRFRPIRLRAPYFGLSRDILVAPDHRVVVSGAEAEYLFGEDSVLAEAVHLVDGKSVRHENTEQTLWYYHVLLDEHECLKYAGMWGESLFVGAMGRSPDLIATTALAAMPSTAIPRHRRFARPVLSAYEARSLAASLCA